MFRPFSSFSSTVEGIDMATSMHVSDGNLERLGMALVSEGTDAWRW